MSEVTKILAKDVKIGQMVFWHKRPGVVTFKSGNSQTIEVTYCRGSLDEDTRQDTREIGFSETLTLLDADFFCGDECIYRTFGAQEDKESEEKKREALVSQSLADKQAANQNPCGEVALPSSKDDDKLRDLADIFSVSKNPFLREGLGALPLNHTTKDWLKEMENMLRNPYVKRSVDKDDDGLAR